MILKRLNERALLYTMNRGVSLEELKSAVMGKNILDNEDVTTDGIIQARAVQDSIKNMTGTTGPMDIYTLWEDQWNLDNVRKGLVRLLVILTDNLVVNATESVRKSIETIRYVRIQA